MINMIKLNNQNNLTKYKLNNILTKLQQLYSTATTDLIYNNEFELLIAVMLSAQATDISVNKVTKILFNIANTPEQMLQLTLAKLIQYIKSIGLYRTKAKNILSTSKILVEQFNSTVPDNLEQLQSLPGVGRKTANVLLNTLWQQPTIAVDTHVFRVARRLGLSTATTPLKVEAELSKIIPKKFKLNLHNYLIQHGRKVCKARNPKCQACIISKLCGFIKVSS